MREAQPILLNIHGAANTIIQLLTFFPQESTMKLMISGTKSIQDEEYYIKDKVRNLTHLVVSYLLVTKLLSASATRSKC